MLSHYHILFQLSIFFASSIASAVDSPRSVVGPAQSSPRELSPRAPAFIFPKIPIIPKDTPVGPSSPFDPLIPIVVHPPNNPNGPKTIAHLSIPEDGFPAPTETIAKLSATIDSVATPASKPTDFQPLGEATNLLPSGSSDASSTTTTTTDLFSSGGSDTSSTTTTTPSISTPAGSTDFQSFTDATNLLPSGGSDTSSTTMFTTTTTITGSMVLTMTSYLPKPTSNGTFHAPSVSPTVDPTFTGDSEVIQTNVYLLLGALALPALAMQFL